MDNFLTSTPDNVAHLIGRPGFTLLRQDVTDELDVPGPVDAVLHLASPASPRDYLRFPIRTLEVGSLGTRRALDLAGDRGSRLLLASTSEIYGDPQEHPQPETYRGNVDPVGPRGPYVEAKRFAEALATAYEAEQGVEVRIARIFNAVGPRMRETDGRAAPTFISQALRGEPLTIHGDGGQTRSICYVADLVEGLWRLLLSEASGPMNLGSPEEHAIIDIARLVAEVAGVEPRLAFVDRPPDDPQVRRPDITRARTLLGWEPRVPLREGLERTVAWFRERLTEGSPSGR